MFAILRPIAQIIEYYPRCVRLVWDAAGPHAILALGVSILGAVVPAAQVWITKVVIDNVVSAVGDGGGAAVDWVGLLIPVAGVFGVWILGSICSAAATGLQEKVGFLAGNHSQYLILRKAAQLDIAFFENSVFFDEMEKARSEIYRSHNLAILSLLIVSSLTGLIAMLAVLLSVHWAAPIILLVTAAPQVIVGGHYAGRRYSLFGARASNRRMAEYLSRILASREAVKEIRIFALHEELLRRFRNFWELFSKETLRLRFAEERFGFLLGLITMLGTASIWAYAVVRAVGGHISVGTVALAFQAAEQARSGFSNLFGNLGFFYEHTIFAGILFRFLDLDPRSVEGALAPPPASPAPDEGVDLSGGEWQKIALSRAFMKEAEVLILDEPTAALDAFAERDVFSRFAELTSERTAIFISHRFSTVRMADHILVLHQGELVEQGSHEQLMAQNGRYAQMFNTQAKQYR